ncbi:DNA topoisomerase (ATP-hydrolyzing) subunit B [Candidatus Pacearchaeota archaeon CG_4_10_14_0_2_um_filter_05_32_18]|nr:MAG: DNA gyrase subunit B [Candidatus Pacearchaeota archaeon CG1_02_32_21]PIZ82669.1 MAG: DNA topoisomerase (ATP-hydrolyzing) subunit B [Candidatus Pacearchaeota archaeon CG_4_10_14_0_2_um_filter_05_32_18]
MPEKVEYTAKNIKVLEGLDAVRMRPSMYIGSTSKEGLHHCFYEVIDNSIDEVQAGEATLIEVTINKDGSLTVIDNGRGIPVEKHESGKSALEVVMTRLHAGGKFESKAYQISGGLHGVGVSCVNALSSKLIVQVKRDGKVYEQTYKIGVPQSAVKVVGSAKNGETGTSVTFYPDPEIFSTLNFDFSVILNRVRELAFLNPNCKIVVIDEGEGKKEEFHYEGGLVEFVKWINRSKSPIHKPVYFKKEADSNIIEVCVQYVDGYQENIFGFVNTINTVEGGTHISGFKTALTRAINDYSTKKGLLKNSDKLTGDDTREGLTAIVSIRMKNPQFEGQTKTKLGNSEVKGSVDSLSSIALGEFFEENPDVASKIANKCVSASKAREAAKKARDLVRRKSVVGFSGLPGKLADCSSKKFETTELYIVEGDSAGGCFSGDTKIALVDGRNISFKQLVEENKHGKKNFCYTIKNDGRIGVEEIKNPRITKKDAEVIKIALDNDQEIICTPNHKFMLRNGGYKEAKDLTKEDSLMPLHKRISKIGGKITIDGYEMIYDPVKKWIFTHMLSDDYNLAKNIYSIEQGEARHHIDFNKRNNNPDNLIRLSKEDHLILHTEHLDKTLHREDVKEKAKQAHQTIEYKDKVKEWARQPEIRRILSENAKEQWKNQDYKEYMISKLIEFYNSNEEYRKINNEFLNESQKEYWANSENRKKASEKVKQFFKENPDAKEYLSNIAKEQWKDEVLLVWRRQKTKEQWTPEFREKRMESYNKTYYNKTIKLMKEAIERFGSLDNFDKIRIEKNDKSILSKKEFLNRFFDNNDGEMLEAINNYNHKIKSIKKLNKKIDVYDIEVPNTHNFALASGVFVHNSAKMARDKEFQAILPLKGKPLNVEKANPVKILSSDEIVNLITAIGAGIKENFDIKKLRYAKVIIMTDADVDGQHIRTLLLTFFYRYIPELIDNGNIYVAVSPLYRVRWKGKDSYVYSDEELEKDIKKIAGNPEVQRFKGLGEMNPNQLWETTMDPKKRILKKITVDDAVRADEVFTMLMGDAVGPRRKFIELNANIAEIDI